MGIPWSRTAGPSGVPPHCTSYDQTCRNIAVQYCLLKPCTVCLIDSHASIQPPTSASCRPPRRCPTYPRGYLNHPHPNSKPRCVPSTGTHQLRLTARVLGNQSSRSAAPLLTRLRCRDPAVWPQGTTAPPLLARPPRRRTTPSATPPCPPRTAPPAVRSTRRTSPCLQLRSR